MTRQKQRMPMTTMACINWIRYKHCKTTHVEATNRKFIIRIKQYEMKNFQRQQITIWKTLQ